MKLLAAIPSFVAALLSQEAAVTLGVSWQAILLALIAAVPPTLLALAAYRSSRQTGADVQKVHTLVNSNATVSAQSLKDARKEIADLRVFIADRSEAGGDKPLPARSEPSA